MALDTQTANAEATPTNGAETFEKDDEVVASAVNEHGSATPVAGRVLRVDDDEIVIDVGSFSVVVEPDAGRFYRSIAAKNDPERDGINLLGIDHHDVTWRAVEYTTESDRYRNECRGAVASEDSRPAIEEYIAQEAAQKDDVAFSVSTTVTYPDWAWAR